MNAKGKRVFDVIINDENVTRIDIFKEVGGFAAHSHHYVAKNLSSTPLIVKLVPVVGSPLICGLENYAIVPADVKTVPEQGMICSIYFVYMLVNLDPLSRLELIILPVNKCLSIYYE